MKTKIAALALACLALAGCDNDATLASRNLSQAADNFEINRLHTLANFLDVSWQEARGRELDAAQTLANGGK